MIPAGAGNVTVNTRRIVMAKSFLLMIVLLLLIHFNSSTGEVLKEANFSYPPRRIAEKPIKTAYRMAIICQEKNVPSL
jgi:hypothetical protein